MKLLIIDDHVLFREGLVSLISRQPDMQVVGEGGSVSETIELARKLHPDLILLDFNLPDGTGLDATRVILTEMPGTRIIFLTIFDEDERLFSAIRLGARGYLLKNIPVARLLASLRGVDKGEPAISPDMVGRLLGEYARTVSAPQSAPNPLSQLSARELDVLGELSTGATNQQIAEKLFISENTVRNHVHKILEKLNIKSRRQAVVLAKQQGLGK